MIGPAVLLAAMLAAGGQAPAGGDAYARAVALQQAGDREGAAAAYRELLKAQPSHVAARSNLGVVLAQLGRYEEAIEAYRAALAVDPKQHKIRLNLGIALYKAARYGDAVTELAAVRTAQPDNLQARYLEADCHLRMGAPKTGHRAARADRADAPGRSRARLHARPGVSPGEGDGEGRRARRPDPQARRIGGSAPDAGDGQARRAAISAGGLEELGKAVALNPELPGVHSLYGRALLETGNRDRAQAEFEAELARNPLDFDAHLYLGVLLKEDAGVRRGAWRTSSARSASGPAIPACATRW